MKLHIKFALTALLLSQQSMAQELSEFDVQTSVSTSQLLDAAGAEQRSALNSIYLIICSDGQKTGAGSGFVLDRGVIVTNSHVVGACTEQNLFAVGTSNEHVQFVKIIKDDARDLAILVPKTKLHIGLKLDTAESPKPGTVVSTWGYPFVYNGASPLLSVGYVAGFKEVHLSNVKTVSHIIVNGAFNHGNSGGPLLISNDNKVIGIVVSTYNFFPPEVKQVIDVMSSQQSGVMYTATSPDGTTKQYTEAQLISMVLDEFYQKTQVMIGEAIAVSELSNMIKEHASELPK